MPTDVTRPCIGLVRPTGTSSGSSRPRERAADRARTRRPRSRARRLSPISTSGSPPRWTAIPTLAFRPMTMPPIGARTTTADAVPVPIDTAPASTRASSASAADTFVSAATTSRSMPTPSCCMRRWRSSSMRASRSEACATVAPARIVAASGQSSVTSGSPTRTCWPTSTCTCDPPFERGADLRDRAVAKIHPGGSCDRRAALGGADFLDLDERARCVLNRDDPCFVNGRGRLFRPCAFAPRSVASTTQRRQSKQPTTHEMRAADGGSLRAEISRPSDAPPLETRACPRDAVAPSQTRALRVRRASDFRERLDPRDETR